MKKSQNGSSTHPSDEEIETMLAKTSALLFDRPNAHDAFLERMLLVRKIASVVPLKLGTCLIAIEGGKIGQAGVRGIKNSVTVGRASNADWCIKDGKRKLSAMHFRIKRHGADYILTDLDSLNGTRINETPKKIRSCFLHHGDFIYAGGCTFMILILGAERQ